MGIDWLTGWVVMVMMVVVVVVVCHIYAWEALLVPHSQGLHQSAAACDG